MQQEILNYPFDEIDNDDRESTESFDRSAGEVFIDRPNTSDTEIKYVNGHNLPEDDEDEDDDTEDDLVLGDEDELDEADLDEDEIDVEVDDSVDDVTDDDLVLDTEEDVDDEEDEL